MLVHDVQVVCDVAATVVRRPTFLTRQSDRRTSIHAAAGFRVLGKVQTLQQVPSHFIVLRDTVKPGENTMNVVLLQ